MGDAHSRVRQVNAPRNVGAITGSVPLAPRPLGLGHNRCSMKAFGLNQQHLGLVLEKQKLMDGRRSD